MRREHPDRVVQRFALVTLMLPTVATAVGLVIEIVALPQVVARIAPGVDPGGSSAWWPAWSVPAVTIVLGLGLPAVIGLSSLPRLRRGDRSPTYRVFGAQALGISVMVNVIVAGLHLEATAAVTPGGRPGWSLLGAGLVAGGVAAAGGWFLQPRGSRGGPAYPVTPLDLGPGERASWLSTTSLPAPALAVMGAVSTIVATRAGVAWARGDRHGGAVILTAITLLLAALLTSTAVFQVRVDRRGLTVQSWVGMPRFRVPLEEVGSVAVLDARALGPGGSWGIRARPGRVVIVMTSSTGIRVTRHDGGTFFVTVDDAATGAALVETLAAHLQAVEVGPTPADGGRGGHDVRR